MSDSYYSDLSYTARFPVTGKTAQFDSCNFRDIDFTELDCRGFDFINCTFDYCNFSMVRFEGNGLDQIRFNHCKMIGTDFIKAKDFLFHCDFDQCTMDYSAFLAKKNKKAIFRNCSLKGADFTEADLSSTLFDRCDLDQAIFMDTNLTGANLVSAFNFAIDPEKNTLKKARFSPHGLNGLLYKYGIIVE